MNIYPVAMLTDGFSAMLARAQRIDPDAAENILIEAQAALAEIIIAADGPDAVRWVERHRDREAH